VGGEGEGGITVRHSAVDMLASYIKVVTPPALAMLASYILLDSDLTWVMLISFIGFYIYPKLDM
jgi:hypothetical protein